MTTPRTPEYPGDPEQPPTHGPGQPGGQGPVWAQPTAGPAAMPPVPGQPVPTQPVPGPPVPTQPLPGAPGPARGYPGPAAGYPAPAPGYQVPPGYGYGYGYGYPSPGLPLSPGGQRLAEFSDRLLARLIDGAILGGVALVIILPIYITLLVSMVDSLESAQQGLPAGSTAFPTTFFAQFFGLFAVIMVLSFGMGYIYQVELMWRRGQTVGKRVMKIRIVPLNPAQPMTRGIAFKRFLIETLAGFVPAGSLLDGLWQLWDKPYRQCLHDKVAQTTVIKLNP